MLYDILLTTELGILLLEQIDKKKLLKKGKKLSFYDGELRKSKNFRPVSHIHALYSGATDDNLYTFFYVFCCYHISNLMIAVNANDQNFFYLLLSFAFFFRTQLQKLNIDTEDIGSEYVNDVMA